MNNIIMDRIELDNEVINELNSNNLVIKNEVVININKHKFDNITISLTDNAHLVINKKYSEKEVTEKIIINLDGIGSRVDYKFSTIAKNNQSYIIDINHNNKNTVSNVINHAVVLNDSKLDFIVNSRVEKGNKKSVLNQTSKIIVMSKNNSRIEPNMYIDEFDVDARHAATIGKFSKDEIFYLMTKGISYKECEKLLIEGFLNIK